MLNKKIVVMAALVSLPLLAQAGDLTLVNNTNSNSTSIMNKTACSIILGKDVGITKAHSTNVVPSRLLSIACAGNPGNCQADVYMNDNCSGKPVATVFLSTTTGYKSKVEIDPRYQVTGSGFRVQLDGGA